MKSTIEQAGRAFAAAHLERSRTRTERREKLHAARAEHGGEGDHAEPETGYWPGSIKLCDETRTPEIPEKADKGPYFLQREQWCPACVASKDAEYAFQNACRERGLALARLIRAVKRANDSESATVPVPQPKEIT